MDKFPNRAHDRRLGAALEELDGLQAVVSAIAEGSRTLGAKIQGGMLEDVLGSTGEVNVQGEIVQKLDTHPPPCTTVPSTHLE